MWGSLVSRLIKVFRTSPSSSAPAPEADDELLLITVKGAAQRLAGSDRWAIEDNLALRIEETGTGKLDGSGVDFESGDQEIFYYGPSRMAMLQAIRGEIAEIKSVLDGKGIEITASAGREEPNLLEQID